MKAILKPLRDIKNYKRLSEVLPLDTPFTLHIDPTNICNFKCKFCPTGNEKLLSSIKRKRGKMSLELFKKIIDDLKEFKHKIKRINLHKDGEPFINSNLCEFIAIAHKAEVAEVIATTTNGSLLNVDNIKKLVNSGLDQIKFSIEHVNSVKYKEITKTYSNYNKIRDNVALLYKEKCKAKSKLLIHSKITDVNLTETEKEKFKADFGPISDSINITNLMGWSASEIKDFTLGVNSEVGDDGVTPIKANRLVCPEPFKTLSINFDGSVSVCCVDWTCGTVVGNVQKESLIDIWNGSKLFEFRMQHLTGKRGDIKACADCHYMKGLPLLSDLDEDRKRLIEIFMNKKGLNILEYFIIVK